MILLTREAIGVERPITALQDIGNHINERAPVFVIPEDQPSVVAARRCAIRCALVRDSQGDSQGITGTDHAFLRWAKALMVSLSPGWRCW